jgi:hypothetical protein
MDSDPQFGNGDGAPHACARLATMGVAIGVAGPQLGPDCAELASSASQVEAGASCTTEAAMVEPAAVTVFEERKLTFAPRSPPLLVTTSPFALSESLANRMKSPRVGVP